MDEINKLKIECYDLMAQIEQLQILLNQKTQQMNDLFQALQEEKRQQLKKSSPKAKTSKKLS